MKQFLLIAMLVIMGQRWEPHSLAIFNMRDDGTVPWVLHYVIGESVNNCQRQLVIPCYHIQERFTIPVPNVPSKPMTREEAEKENQKLSR